MEDKKKQLREYFDKESASVFSEVKKQTTAVITEPPKKQKKIKEVKKQIKTPVIIQEPTKEEKELETMRTNERETLLQEYPQLLEYYYSKKLIDNDLNNIAKIITYTKNNGKLQLDILHHPPKDLMTIVTIRTSCMEAKVYEEFAKMEYYFNILTATNIFVMKKDNRLTDYYYTFFIEEVEVIETPTKEEKVEDTPIVIEDNSDVKMLYKVIPYLVTLVGVLLPYVLNLHGLPKWGMLIIFVIDAVIVAYSCNELIKMG